MMESTRTPPHHDGEDGTTPLILVTNDDGVHSPGLHALVDAICDLGQILVTAPSRQHSNAGRSHPPSPVRDKGIRRETIPISCPTAVVYALDSSPAQSVMRAMVELVPRPPDLVISGINYGENMGSGITVSGTIGAAIEAACFGLPALAVSLQTPGEFHYNPSDTVDFTAAAAFSRQFAQMMLAHQLPSDVDILKVDVPSDATPDTSWRITRASRQSYYVPLLRPTPTGDGRLEMDYKVQIDMATLEPDSDIQALAVDRVVSVCPLSIDMTSRIDATALSDILRERQPVVSD